MATGWVRSLQCKSNAFDDVFRPSPKPSPNKKKDKPLLPLDCGNPSHALRDVVFLFPAKPHTKRFSDHQTPRRRTRDKPRPKNGGAPGKRTAAAPLPPPASPTELVAPPISFPSLAELPEGHSSRRVVEIIFGSSWSRRGAPAPFPGEIELLFRIHHPSRAVARFEEYRATVRARAAAATALDDGARCAADGNEMMRFHSAPSASGDSAAGYDAGAVCAVAAWGGKVGGIRTFAGSGGAHESAGGGAGRRAMLVCRVVAGRVRAEPQSDSDGRFDSVAAGKGELLVFDPRAVLPCFLIIYKT